MSVGSETRPVPEAARRSLGRSRPRYGEAVIKGLLFSAALVSVATTLGIVASLVPPAAEFFQQVSFSAFLTGTDWSPLIKPRSYGVLPLVGATLLITAIAVAVAVPFGIASAIYLSEYASDRNRRILKPVLEILAGIPTVVYGFFALAFVTPLLGNLFGDRLQVFNGLAAGLVMGVMIIPTVASLSEDAMSAVPHALRDGAYALGATKRIVATTVVVPAALSGIVASVVLGISRAIGETMIVTIASGNRPNLTWDPLQAMQTMTGFIAQAGSGDLPTSSFDYKTIFAVGALLFVMTFIMNMLSIRLIRKYREVYE